MNDAVTVLIKARTMVQQGWVQHTGRSGDRRCAGQAIQDSVMEILGNGGISMPDVNRVHSEARDAFALVTCTTNIPAWNDAEERTQQEVVRAFDQTIDLLSITPEEKIAVVPEPIEATWKPVHVPIEKVVIEGPLSEPISVVKKALATLGV